MSSNIIYSSPLCSCIICREIKSAKGIHSHVNQSHNPSFKSDWKEKNKSDTRQLTVKAKNFQSLLIQLKEYYLCPKICSICNKEIDWFRRNNKFCSSTCGAIHSNTGKTHTIESRQKRGNTIKKTIQISKNNKTYKTYIQKVCKVCFTYCTICSTPILHRGWAVSRKTCSRECQIHASVGNRTYKNGRRLNIYYKKIDGSTVLLESSWEELLAIKLDELTILWERPMPIKWTDKEGKQRLYYPDFFLPEIGLYLDPKNPTALANSIDKMNVVASIIPIWIGDITKMISQLHLVKKVGFYPMTQFFTPVPKTGGIDH